MSKSAVTLLFLFQLAAFVNYSNEQQYYNSLPANPCPHIFEYRPDSYGYYGVIRVNSPRLEQRDVLLQVELSLRATTTQNDIKQITLLASNQETTNNIINRQPISYRVPFPFSSPIPRVVKIIYDGSLICSGPAEDPNAGGVVSTVDLKHVLNTYTTLNNNYYSTQPQTATTYYQQPTYQPQPQQPVYQQQPVYSQPTYQTQPTYQQQQPTYQQQQPTYQTQPTYQPVYQQPTQSAASSTSQDANAVCGQRYATTTISPFIVNGLETKRGDWPWMVAIYLNKPTGLSFNCGGSLVSARAVLSAAHCINTATKNYQAHEVLLWLGRYSLTDWNEAGAISNNVQYIYIHPDYKRQRESYDADISILLMTRTIQFTEFVRPICLWPATNGIADVEGQRGTVVGWGKDGSDRIVSTIPKKVDLPIVNSLTCVQTSESLAKVISPRTFCAGTLNGDGPCHGDSGGGLTLYRQNRWTLRGIVSAGLSDANTGACKLMDYVVFTDISRFNDWIRTYI